MGKYLGAPLLDCVFSFARSCQTIFKSGRTILQSHLQWILSSFFSTSSPAFDTVSVLDFNHSIRCVVVSCFNLQFSNGIWYWMPFYMLICSLHVFCSDRFWYLGNDGIIEWVKKYFLFFCFLKQIAEKPSRLVFSFLEDY